MRIPFLAAAIVFTVAVCVFADTVYLKDGRKLEGEIVSEGEESIKLKMKYGVMTISRSDIERIEKEPASDKSKPEPERKPPKSGPTKEPAQKAKSTAAERRLGRKVEKLLAGLQYTISPESAKELVKIGKPAVEPLIELLGKSMRLTATNAAEILGKIRDKRAVEPLIKVLRSGIGDHNMTLTRQRAATALGQIGDRRAVKPLIETLKEGYAHVSSNACVALGELGDRKAVKPLIEKLSSRSADMRRYAAVALSRIGDKSAIPHIEKMFNTRNKNDKTGYGKTAQVSAAYALVVMRKDEKAYSFLLETVKEKNHFVRMGAIRYLGELRDERAIPVLIRELISAEMYDARKALANIGEPAVLPLLRIAKRRVDRRARQNALWALGDIGSKSAVEPLIEIFKDRNCIVRGSALTALRKIGDKRAVDPLLAMLDTEKEYANVIVIFAAKMGDERAIKPLVKIVKEDKRSRKKASDTLVELGKAAVRPLAELLAEKDKDVVACAARALAEIGDGDAVEPLGKLLQSESWDMRQTGLSALSEIGSDKAVEALSTALKHSDRETRLKTIESLGLTYSESAVKPLAGVMLKNESDRMRAEAARTLGDLDYESALEPLVKALKDKSERVRTEAIKALSRIGGEKAFKALLKVIKSGGSDARRDAISALAEIGDSSAIETLVRLLKESTCRNDASRALRKVGKPAVPALIEALSEKSSGVRSAATRILKWITGEDFGEDQKKWKKWLRENQ